MNLLHMKYAVEIAKTNSINKAADRLYVGQSALSRAIKELEAGLGVTLFDRSARGMFLTPDGELFIHYAKSVLEQVDAIENLFSGGTVGKRRFSVSVPRASYIADAFARFSGLLDKTGDAELFYKETNAMSTINHVLEDTYRLGIIRYAERYDRYYKTMLEEKGLVYELVAEFSHRLIVRADSPLAAGQPPEDADLQGYTQIARADPYVPPMPFEEVRKEEELPEISGRRIFVFERASQFELLAQNPNTYMWASSVPEALLARYGLVQLPCDEGRSRPVCKDVLIHRRSYTLTDLDKLFIEQLVQSKREVFE